MRVLSYNIHKGIGGRDRRYDLDRVLRVIEHENPDLVCLQEVTRHARRTAGDDQPHLLCDRLSSAAHCFQMNVRYRTGGYGNLILSRWPFREHHHVCLRKGRWKPRGAQVAVIDTPGGPLRLANWHLGLGERERHWQARKLLAHPHLAADLPTLLVGDCNDWRNTLAGTLAGAGFEPVARPASRFRSFPAVLPVLALDKAFARGRLEVLEARIVRTPLAHRASDHLPLVVDVRLNSLAAPSGSV